MKIAPFKDIWMFPIKVLYSLLSMDRIFEVLIKIHFRGDKGLELRVPSLRTEYLITSAGC